MTITNAACGRCSSRAWKPFGYSPKCHARFRCLECGKVQTDHSLLRPASFGDRVSVAEDTSPEQAALALVRAGLLRIDADGSVWKTTRIDKWGHRTPLTPPQRADILDAAGYRRVWCWVQGKQYNVLAHRLLWAYHHGDVGSCRIYNGRTAASVTDLTATAPQTGRYSAPRVRHPRLAPRTSHPRFSSVRATMMITEPVAVRPTAPRPIVETPVERMWPRVRRIALRLMRRRQYPRHVELDDLVSAGAVGLVDAATRFDPARGTFATFATHRVEGAMVDYLRERDPLTRDQRRESRSGAVPFQEVQLEHLPPWVQFRSRESSDFTQPLIDRDVERVIEQLPPRERHVIRNYFFEERVLREIGQDLGVSEIRASQLKARALQRLRSALMSESC